MKDGERAESRSRDPVGRAPIVCPGTNVGRFSILSEVGSGGMGRIYEAYDPNLDRRVALKLLRDIRDDEHRKRLVREARALARLDHPNVVKVHDVGLHEGALFVAMEFARGGTLEGWLATHPTGGRPRFERAIRLLVDAGRGLVAAHGAGLVHRDIKPSNILIGADGRARVADFGIARSLDHPDAGDRPSGDRVDQALMLSTDDAESVETATGTSTGTPAYMAPEQFGRAPVDAAADQFSYCVTCWETLFGVRPFAAPDPRARLAAIRNGEPDRPHGVDVEPEIEALLRRGLSYLPSDRHAQLDDLVDAFDRAAGPARSPRPAWRWWLGAGVVALVAAGSAYRVGQSRDSCGVEAARSFEEVWNDERRNSTAHAVLGSGLAPAPAAWARLETGVDAYADAWREAHTEACEATQVRAEQTPERMDEQVACLDDAKRSVDALLSLVSSGEPGAIENEQGLLQALPTVQACAQVRGLPSVDELPVLDALARARMLRGAGRSGEALDLVEPIARALDETTSRTVRARVLLEYGHDLADASNPRQAIEPLREAYAIAQAEEAVSLAAAAARSVARLHTVLRSEPDTVRRWVETAKSEDVALSLAERVELLASEGALLRLSGDPDGATRALERSVELAGSDGALLPHARRRLALELKRMRAKARAVEVAREALEEYRDHFGAEHPGVADFERTLALVLHDLAILGGYPEEGEEAVELARRALTRANTAWGEGHIATIPHLVRLSSALCGLHKDTGEGLALAKAALELHAEGELSLARHDALQAFIHCALRRHDQFAKEAWEFVYVSEQLYGERHQSTLLARARYVQALLRAPHPDNQPLWKELVLASELAKERLPGWDRRRAIFIHGILASVTVSGRPEMALDHAQAALDLLKDTSDPEVGLETKTRTLLCKVKSKLGNLEGGLEDCLLALEVAPADPQPRLLGVAEHTTAVVLSRLARNAEARPHAENAVRRFEEVGMRGVDLSKAHVLLAEINEQLGHDVDAADHYRAALDLPGLGKIDRFRVGTGLSRVLGQLGHTEEAWNLFRDLEATSRDDDPFHQSYLAETRGHLRHVVDPRRGAGDYRKALELSLATGGTLRIEQICRRSPFELAECTRLGYESGQE